MIYTPDTFNYGLATFTSLLDHVEFEVTACSDAFLALSLVPNDLSKDTYEIVIGGAKNKQTVIRTKSGGEAVASAETPDILSCTESRYASNHPIFR